MAERVEVARASEIAPGTGVQVQVGDRAIAVLNSEGVFHALDGTCLHRGGPVGEGDIEEGVVTCPWHGWQYDVRTGENVLDRAVKLRTYPVEVEHDRVVLILD